MSRQYLKQLKERAEKLLEVSDYGSDQEDINAYTATQGGTRSPRRIVLDQIMPEEPQSSPEEVSEFYEHETTDIELLKRCISLTNQNNNLKFLVEKLSTQVQSLKSEIKSKSEIEGELRLRLQSREVSNDRRDELLKFEQAMHLIDQQKKENEQEKASLKRTAEGLECQRASLKRQMEESLKLLRSRQSQGRESKREIQIHNDYTIKNTKKEDVDRLKYRYEEMQARLKRFEEIIRQERNKCHRLCKFINKEIPSLNNTIIELSAKLQAKFQRQFLRQNDY